MTYDDLDPQTIVFPELEGCIVGIVTRFGQPPIVCYDYDKAIAFYRTQFGEHVDAEDDALEWMHHNTMGTWAGDTTPCFIHLMPPPGDAICDV